VKPCWKKGEGPTTYRGLDKKGMRGGRAWKGKKRCTKRGGCLSPAPRGLRNRFSFSTREDNEERQRGGKGLTNPKKEEKKGEPVVSRLPKGGVGAAPLLRKGHCRHPAKKGGNSNGDDKPFLEGSGSRSKKDGMVCVARKRERGRTQREAATVTALKKRSDAPLYRAWGKTSPPKKEVLSKPSEKLGNAIGEKKQRKTLNNNTGKSLGGHGWLSQDKERKIF